MAKKELPWTGSEPCNCTVPDPDGRRVQDGISYNPCRSCGRPITLTDEQIDGRRRQRDRQAETTRR